MRSDNRVHTFTYAFTAWEGDFAGCDVVAQGYDVNVPLRVVKGRAGISGSLADISQPNIILEALKPAEDGSGDLIFRFYESKKAAVKAQISTFVKGQVWLCDMEENRISEVPAEDGSFELDFRAFEIKTIRIGK